MKRNILALPLLFASIPTSAEVPVGFDARAEAIRAQTSSETPTTTTSQ